MGRFAKRAPIKQHTTVHILLAALAVVHSSAATPPANLSSGAFYNGLWLLDYDGSGAFESANDSGIVFGQPGDLPVPGPW